MNHASTWRYPADAWQWACNTIQSRGDLVKSEDGQLTKEVTNLMVTILEPLAGWPIAGSGWENMAALDRYAEQLMNPDNQGFDYTYGNRLMSYGEPAINQIEFIISQLFYIPESRRSVAITWNPHLDTHNDIAKKHVPCLQLLDFLIRGGKLHCTAVFRSWDVGRAMVPNMYGLGKLMLYVADAVGVPMGSLTIVAASGHIYQD